MSEKYKNTLQYFYKESSLFSFKYISSKHIFIRLLWVFVHIFLCIITVTLVSIQYISFMQHPTLTTVQPSTFPASKIPFPGISICSINKISKTKAIILAQKLSNISNETSDAMLKLIQLLGYMYEYKEIFNEDVAYFQQILNQLNMNPRDLMRYLTPSCDDLIVKCLWGNKQINCSKEFTFDLTYEGFCCLFNYLKIKKSVSDISDIRLSDEVKFQKNPGVHNGLKVYINNNPDEYFFATTRTIGVHLHIFDPRSYPDIASGGLSHLVVGMGMEFFVSLHPSLFDASLGIMKYSINKRGCIFGSELKTAFGIYSESDCLVSCKTEKMIELCNCVPFQIPLNKTYVCQLEDMLCLSAHRSKWNYLAPGDFEHETLAFEKEDGLHCGVRCYPACNSILYSYLTNSVSIRKTSKNSAINQNNSIIYIHYKSSYANLYYQDEVFVWYEMLGTFGGIFSLVIGISTISVTELIIFCIKLIYYRSYNK